MHRKCFISVLTHHIIKGKKNQSVSEDRFKQFRAECIKFLRFPQGVALDCITTLDLHDCGLFTYDLKPFINLEVLLLNKNEIKTVEVLYGLYNIKSLQVLDLRDNLIDKIDDFYTIVNTLRSLITLGIRGNKCTNSKVIIVFMFSLIFEYCSGSRAEWG